MALTGSIVGGLTGLLWGGAVRVFLLHHATFSINSLCHSFGRRPFTTGDESRNLAWLAPLAFGEAWHNNHHAFPTSARHGLRPLAGRPRRVAHQRARALPSGLGRRPHQPRAPAGQAHEGPGAGTHVSMTQHAERTTPADPRPAPKGMVPARERRRTGVERGFMRVIATGGIIGIAVVLGAILASQNVAGWIMGLVIGLTSVILAAVLWSSRQL